MNNRVEFFGDIFKGIGLGITVGCENKILICVGTFLCFNFYIEVYLGKKQYICIMKLTIISDTHGKHKHITGDLIGGYLLLH